MRKALVVLALIAGCTADPQLGAITQASFVADPTSWDFGGIAVGSSDAKTIVVATMDDGGDDLVIVTSTCTDFTVTPPTDLHVTIADPVLIEVTFAPTTAGAFDCDVAISGNDTGSEQTINFVGTGTVAGAVATLVTSTAMDFGEVPVGVTTAVQPIEIRNDGASPLTITSHALVSGGPDFGVVVSAGATPIDPGNSMVWDVTCTPPADGALAGVFEITTDDPAAATIDVSLACTGVSTTMYVLPVPAVFGEVLTGGSLVLDFELHNDGTGGESVSSATIDNPAFTESLNGGTVAGGATLPFQITFTPTEDGEATGTLTIVMASGKVVHVGLAGRGATALISVTPPDPIIDLGTACVGGMTPVTRISFRNAGTGSFQLAGVNFDPQYPFTGNGLDLAPAVIPPGVVDWRVDAWFEPTVPGDVDGAYQINTNIPGDTAHRVPLHGRGLEAVVGATETSHDFGAVGVGALSSADDLGVLNCTLTTVNVAVAITGDDADAYEILPGDPTENVNVATGTTTVWSTLFRPTHQGPHVAAFVITWADGSVEIPLSGLGIEDLVPPGDEDGRGTYLACSSGGGAGGAWPVLLALLLLRRRVR